MYSRFTRSSTAGIWQAASLTFSTRTCDNDTRSEKTVRIAFHRQLKNGEFFNRQLGSEIPKKTYTRIHYHAGSLRGRRLNGRRKGRRRARKALEERTRIPRRSFWLPSPAVQASSREEFENAALFLRIGLPSTLIRHENGTFRNGSSTWRNMKSPIFRFRVFDGKRFENGARWSHDNHVIFLTEFASNTNPMLRH